MASAADRRKEKGSGDGARGDETLVEIARTYNVSHMTISRLKERRAAS